MRLIFVLLSPTFGMHQYAADLANRIADRRLPIGDWEETTLPGQAAARDRDIPKSAIRRSGVVVVTTVTYPRDRYGPAVRIETPLTSHGTGFSGEGLDRASYQRVLASMRDVLTPDRAEGAPVVHFAGVHAWNVPLVWTLRRRGIPVIHTLHDLNAHGGVRHGRLIGLWNRLIIGSGCHLLVHGRRYRDELLTRGVPASRVTHVPLLHGFWGYGAGSPADFMRDSSPGADGKPQSAMSIERDRPDAAPVLFFGRIEAYKGVDVLLKAWESLQGELPGARLVIAGPVATGVVLPSLPRGVELRDRRIEDGEAFDLFRSASLLVLPYRDATQSALVATAYAFDLPVIVTETGALPEYVVEGETGWIVQPSDPGSLATVLRSALADSGRLRAMGLAGRAWVGARREEEQAALWQMYTSLAKVEQVGG